MIKALVSVYPDLASVIAMNYVCRLSRIFDMEIQPIFVKELEEANKAPAVGWVRQTWENSLLDVEQEAMNKLIEAEKTEYARLASLQVYSGNRQEAILDNLLQGGYDLFVEGSVSRFEKSELLRRTRSRLYQNLPCPAIIARNLIDFDKVLIVIGEMSPAAALLPRLTRLFAGASLRFDLLHCTIIEAGPLEPVHPQHGLFDEADDLLAAVGWQPENRIALQGTPKDLGSRIGEYSMVATTLPAHPERHGGLLELLSNTPSPVLFCRP
ncbi:MAG: hypothetical protein LJE64_13160 [Desulfofustis sp.]|nr:hypothetical protein [Desulfofustis sp.]